ncbi:hypothetical protein [Crenothrix sp.]|uniref:hypothetical protein n=1 Tax=Crenothrix sp. TaxID=3100433 RepID=UPI00374D40A8
MPLTTVISAHTVLEYLEHDNGVIIDCRYSVSSVPPAGLLYGFCGCRLQNSSICMNKAAKVIDRQITL